ncbi:TPA: AAC(3) family N-acetyltransferase [Enterococcus faecium]|uniref:AAC(3) family N-acetyltransferase n=1 Tax=Enterococcus faecium TaxID=1352 RepID=UPI0011223C53|nr:AAC(3) family N-acetyltransferase [Enterococcus faecium]MCU7382713.1 AAC(3) family N-acetyltransferase [Enterococcus faecium]QDB89941.1 AAC(3) family N-acetyltransferase [Enterococcus faecium]HAQ7747623.1 AAC(3) family N-acetyltransferase [Enterococcus faecium]HCD9885509.1 AAC(3) family N-acetyltransferase [Enterococcus faecium]
MNLYDEFVSNFVLNSGDTIWLSSELVSLVLKFKKNNIVFDGNELINAFQRAVGENGTILIPTFSFEFSNNKYYDIVNTKGVTGALGNLALKRVDFKRTQHPMHSFAVWGKNQKLLVSMKNKHSFGIDSPFGYCVSRHVRQIIIGTDYVHAMTFIHYAEVTCNVPYRFSKSFTGDYVDEKGNIEIKKYDYEARKLEIQPEEKFNRMGSILEEKKVSKKINIDGIECYDIDLARSYPIICKDIIENNCKHLYDFNISRKKIFSFD